MYIYIPHHEKEIQDSTYSTVDTICSNVHPTQENTSQVLTVVYSLGLQVITCGTAVLYRNRITLSYGDDEKLKIWILVLAIILVVCMVTHYSKSTNQPGKVANPARGQLNRENEYSPVHARA